MSRIIRVEVGRFDYDFVGEFKFFKPDPDGKVRRPSVLVRLTDENGLQGWGQAVPVPTWTYETVESVESTLTHYLAPAILSADVEDIEDIHHRMSYAIKPGFSTGQPLSKAAIDLACYDLLGKQRGESIAKYLGGSQQDGLLLNWTVNSPDMETVEQQLEEGRQRGYQNYTIKIGPPQTPAYDLKLIRTVKAYAPDSFIWADANTGYTLETALDILPRLADAGLEVIESPLPPSSLRGYQQLKRLGAVPVYMDEGIISPAETAEFIALGMMDGITMKPARCGGLMSSLDIIQLARENGISLLGSGLSDPDLSLAAAVQLYAWAGFERPCALNGPQFLANSLAENPFLPVEGRIKLPELPGLGLKMGPQAESVLQVAAGGKP